MPNVLICNSAKEKSEDLGNRVSGYCSEQIQSIIYFEKEEALLSYLEESNPEPSILIIDLEFCEDGVGVAERAIEINPWSGIIFYSGSGKWDLNVYEIDHAYGLEYPLSKENLTAAIDKAIDKIDKAKTSILPVKEKGITHPVNIKEILYFEKDRRIIHIHTERQAYSMYIKFDEFTNDHRHSFVRCHNSFVVNFLHVRGMQEFSFLMRNGAVIPISRSRRNQSREEYEAYITRQPLNNFENTSL